MASVEKTLDKAQPHSLADMLRKLRGFGQMLAAMRPRNRSRTGLTSQATHVHDVAAQIWSVESPQGTPLSIISGGSPGASEVSVDYDADTGVPTLVFNGSVTEYHTTESGSLPQGLAAAMAEDGQTGS